MSKVAPVNIKTALLIKAWHGYWTTNGPYGITPNSKMRIWHGKKKKTVGLKVEGVRIAERSKAMRSGRSLLMQAWVRIPLLTSLQN